MLPAKRGVSLSLSLSIDHSLKNEASLVGACRKPVATQNRGSALNRALVTIMLKHHQIGIVPQQGIEEVSARIALTKDFGILFAMLSGFHSAILAMLSCCSVQS